MNERISPPAIAVPARGNACATYGKVSRTCPTRWSASERTFAAPGESNGSREAAESAAQWAADSAALDAYLAQPEWISEVAVHPVTLPALAAWIAAGHCPIQALAQSRSELDGLCSDDLGHPRWAWCPGDAPVTLMAVPADADPVTVPDLLSLADQHGNMFPDAPKPDPLGPLVRAYLEARGGSPP